MNCINVDGFTNLSLYYNICNIPLRNKLLPIHYVYITELVSLMTMFTD